MFNLRHITKTIIFVFGVFFCGMLAAQGNSRLVAVLEPVGNDASVTPLNKRSVRGTLEEFITKSRDYKAVDRARTNAILEEHSFQRNGMVDKDKVQEIGKMLGANFVFVSELYKEGGFINISISLIDAGTGVLAGARSKMMEGDNPMAIQNLVEEMASDLLGVESQKQKEAREQAETKKNRRHN
jgi:TolB-like protein